MPVVTYGAENSTPPLLAVRLFTASLTATRIKPERKLAAGQQHPLSPLMWFDVALFQAGVATPATIFF